MPNSHENNNPKKPEYNGIGIYFQDVFYYGVECAACGDFTIAHPEKAISVRLPSDPHTRRAICPSCVKLYNIHRADIGLPAVTHTPDAYLCETELAADGYEYRNDDPEA
jgi:hypothetical protein